MRMTAMDINSKEFKKVIRGYDMDEVDEFLDQISEDYETLYKENSAYKDKVSVLEEKVEHYAKIENTIQNTLLLAQNSAEQAKQTAQKEADLIIKNANESAKRILDKANNDILRLNDDYEKLRQDFVKFRAKFRNFMNSQMEMFNGLENEFAKNYNIGKTVEGIREKEAETEGKDEEFKVKNIDLPNNDAIEDLTDIKSFFVND